MPKSKRVMISMDERLLIAIDKLLDKFSESGVFIKTKSQLIEVALVNYLQQLETLIEKKGENNEN